MNQNIKIIEDLSLNAWPSHQIQVYDGWILRFSYFYTHRTNSVEQIGSSTIPIKEKIEYCERVYEKWGTPAIFKISPLVDRSFDYMLSELGYEIGHTTEVMAMDLTVYKKQPHLEAVCLSNQIRSEWIEGLFALKDTANVIHRQIVPSMYRAIPKDTIAACIYKDGKIVATGLGILDREYIGLYAIHVDTRFRQKHWGYSICSSILNEGIRRGATKSYLQVVKGNLPARKLYQSLGFEYLYTYWFRQKTIF